LPAQPDAETTAGQWYHADMDELIHADIRQAWTLPARFYRAETFAAHSRAVFEPSWQFIGDDDPLKTPSSVLPLKLHDGLYNEPILLTRDDDDRLHCLSNVCTHRGTVLVHGAGHEKTLTCRYHGRRFALDGTFKFMPEFDGCVGFPSERDNLSRVPLGRWGSFLFASMRPGAEFDSWIGDMRSRLDWLPLQDFRFDPTRSRDYLVNAHWALYVENYLEGFHIPFVHASLNDQLDYSNYRTEMYAWSSLQVGIGRGGDHGFDLPPTSPDKGQKVAAYYWWLFPNLMFNFYPWGLSVNVVRPLAFDRTRVSFLTYVWDASKLDRGAGAGLDRVEREDEAVVEAEHRGMQSSFYSRGRYSPTREQGVHHFHRLLSQVTKIE
jgi:choline monooxygenase